MMARFLTFTACKKSRLGLKRGKELQCVSNRCKDLFERKKYFGVRCTLMHIKTSNQTIYILESNNSTYKQYFVTNVSLNKER